MNANIKAKTQRSQKFFSVYLLAVYDFLVFTVVLPYIWRCPTQNILAYNKKNISDNHLDVGVGTGYILEHCQLTVQNRVALLDLSQNCLNKASQRLSALQPEVYLQNILEPITISASPFKSISLNFVMHCVPGSFKDKGAAFRHLKSLLNPNGVLFGCSLMYEGVTQPKYSRMLMRFLNTIGLLNNTVDNPTELKAALQRGFAHVEIEVIGCVALFKAWD